ncbi:MAG TPA: hypothetical protein EYN91_00850 [Candidatus Melainabacteria bacterium]|jgi:hypothetical protein|nr:hypothetical protein [Candidatus Melainabacteria bacterium]HIN66417.1 hypothetical protein [Candidatus Obscuribacterales bacterium]
MSSVPLEVGQNADEAVKKVVERSKPVAFNTNAADRRKAEEAVCGVYTSAGLKAPRYFVWFDSPFHGAIAAAMVSKGTKSVHKQVVTDLKNQCSAKLWKMIDAKGDKLWWTTVQSKLTPALKRSFATLPQQIRRAVLASFVGHVGPGVDNINLELVWGQLAPPALLSKLVGQLCHVLPEEITKPFEEFDDRPLTCGLAISAMGQFAIAGYGNLDADLPFYDITGAAGFRVPEIMPLFHIARFGHYWWPFDDVCLMVDRPIRLSVDEEGLLHNPIGCALRYRDGWETFAWHGTFVPDRFLEFGIKKDVTHIFYEPNVEIRRMMLEMYGLEAFIKDSGAKVVQRDKCGVLYRQHFGDNHEDIVIVHVVNSTPEPDGTYNNYFLRVPPETKTAREGVAWTFGLTADEYDPLKET